MAKERSQLWEKAQACGEALQEVAQIRAAMRVDPDLARFAGVVDKEVQEGQVDRLLANAKDVAALTAATEPRSAEIYTACARTAASAFRIAQDEAERSKARIAAKRKAMLVARDNSG